MQHRFVIGLILGVILLSSSVPGQPTQPSPAAESAKSDAEQERRASEWAATLSLSDPAKAARVKDAIATHLKAVRDWHNEHPYTLVPEGINPANGKKLSTLDRQFIADSAMPKS